MANGWANINKKLILEWELYFKAMVQTSPIYHPDDAAELIAELRGNIELGTEVKRQATLQQEMDHAWGLNEMACHPMPRPEGHIPARARWSPLDKQ